MVAQRKIPFTEIHILRFLEAFQEANQPLDLALQSYFRAHKALGARDRRAIGDAVYGMIRWKSLLSFASPHLSHQFAAYQRWQAKGEFPSPPSLPEWARYGSSPFLYQKLLDAYGEKEGKRLCTLLNERAPTTLRANLLKTNRDELLLRWKGKFSLTPCPLAPQGISLKERAALFSLPEFREGLFEVQDEGSQLVAALVAARPGDLVLDLCSGSGGKSLAIAPCLKGKGQIYLSDIRPPALREARQRLRRAGVQNSQCLLPGHPQLLSLKGKCDWVLIDVPCSGTGTLRRNPDQKWKIDSDMLARLVASQREIAKEGATYLAPKGKLVYATCSLLPEENEAQVAWMGEALSLELESFPLSLLPESGGRDGFFAAVLRKKIASLI